MSYEGISVRQAMGKINQPHGSGWFLPQVQRQYAWAKRYESETYICLLLDSLVKRYPVGGLVLWETESCVAHREFIRDYVPNEFSKQVDSGRWANNKCLVYDGQQRLQTLYSTLHHTFNARVAHFDLLFDIQEAESDETGFLFRDQGVAPDPRYLRLTELGGMPCNPSNKIGLEDRVLSAMDLDKPHQLLVRTNLAALWDVFVDTNVKSLAFFSVSSDDVRLVNEVFRRLNTGGLSLTQNELVLSKIKAEHPDYEEKLWALSDAIDQKTNGLRFSSDAVLQFFHLLVKGTVRIDESRFSSENIPAFVRALEDQDALTEVFEGYLWGLFRINHASIVPRWLAVLPIAVYLIALKRAGHPWRIRSLSADALLFMEQYFLLSQFCDWNTQTMVNAFAGLATEAGTTGASFPLDSIRKIAVQKNRSDALSYQQFVSLPLLATKVLTPGRSYAFKPQVDHIFPYNLAGADDSYRRTVDVLWNFQPMPAGINNYKRARHPQEFFLSTDGAKYLQDYDFVPSADSPIWNDAAHFLRYRHRRMRKELKNRYGLTLKRIKEKGQL